MKKIIILSITAAAALVVGAVVKRHHLSSSEQVEVETEIPVENDEQQQVEIEAEKTMNAENDAENEDEPVDIFRNFSTPEKKADDFLREFNESLSEIIASADKVISDNIAEDYAESLRELKVISDKYEKKASALTEEIREKALAGEDISSLCDELSRTMADTRDALK